MTQYEAEWNAGYYAYGYGKPYDPMKSKAWLEGYHQAVDDEDDFGPNPLGPDNG